ncbi:MAG TPA: hypothetical protein VGB83_10065 [Actinomycetota bacterium]
MRKAKIVLACAIVAAVAGGVGASEAQTKCTKDRTGGSECRDRANKKSPWGPYYTRCDGGTDVGGAFTLYADPATGVSGCADSGDTLPVKGRVGGARQSDDSVSVFIDGSDRDNESSAGGWQRYDVGADGVHARRGSGGTWYTGAQGGDGSSNPDALDCSVSAAGPEGCP